MKSPTQKPVRVATGTVELLKCPVCRESIMGEVEMEAHLGEFAITTLPDGDLSVDAPATVRARNLDVRHRCGTTFRDQEGGEG